MARSPFHECSSRSTYFRSGTYFMKELRNCLTTLRWRTVVEKNFLRLKCGCSLSGVIVILVHRNGQIILKNMLRNCAFCNVLSAPSFFLTNLSFRRVPFEGDSSMCLMCLKYRNLLLIVIKNPWKYYSYICFAPQRRPYPARALKTHSWSARHLRWFPH